MIKYLSIDIECYSDVNLKRCGVYKYAASPNFEIMLFSVSVNGGAVKVYDLASGDTLPENVLLALTDDNVLKWAYNASFERICLSAWMRREMPEYFSGTDNGYLPPTSWRCSMIWGAYIGLPQSLKDISSILNLSTQKMKEGVRLIRQFCMPRKDGGRNLPQNSPADWAIFKTYNRCDVEVEIALQKRLAKIPVPDFIWKEYRLDQEINDRGIQIDTAFVKQAVAISAKSQEMLMAKMKELTGLENPNSVLQLKKWLARNGLSADSIGKKQVCELLAGASPAVAEVLKLRQQLAKSSVKKYLAMQNVVCPDGRARGMFQFYGANRSGRWAGRLIQLQNLPQNHMLGLDVARSLVKSGDYKSLCRSYASIPNVLSELIRTAFVPRAGYKFIVADFSAVEARVIAWLADESWRMRVFADGGDIYCASASKMFNVPVEKHGINSHLRQKGKIAELALGYGGSVGALKAMGALEMGLSESELLPLVQAWREANPHIVQFWHDVDKAVKTAILDRLDAKTHGIKFCWRHGILLITLPSKRQLCYVRPKLGINRYGYKCVTYEGIGATKKWERIESYGPKFVENIVQAVARDLLMHAMQTLSYCSICGHVHDEIIIEASTGVSVDAICAQMARTPPWAEGLLLRADGYESEFYKKE